MKTNILKLTALLLILVGSLSSCDKLRRLQADEIINEINRIYNDTNLQGSKWILVGIVDIQADTLRELEPKDGKFWWQYYKDTYIEVSCYSLEFITDSTLCTFSSTNENHAKYKADYETNSFEVVCFGGTRLGEIGDGDLYSDLFAERQIKSFSLQKNELRLYYNNENNYLLFKRIVL